MTEPTVFVHNVFAAARSQADAMRAFVNPGTPVDETEAEAAERADHEQYRVIGVAHQYGLKPYAVKITVEVTMIEEVEDAT